MAERARFCLLIACAMGMLAGGGTAAAETATLKCNASRDQIWVYDSLTTFNVEARLKCGESVEVIARVQDYVKIRTRNGVDGYVPDAAIAGLAPFKPYTDASGDVGMAAKQIQANEVARAAADAASLAPADLNYSGLATRSSAPDETSPKIEGASTAAPRISIAAVNAFAEASPVPVVRAPEKLAPHAAAEAEPSASQPPAGVATTPREEASVDAAAEAEPPVSQPPAGVATTLREEASVDATAPNVARPLAVAAPRGENSSELSNVRMDGAIADLACESYFSAYGLTPGQMKWIAQNRSKAFSSVCPAPDPSKVDFVIIFTHDVDFFSGTMPELVHKSNGFSDFTPLAPLDTALIPESQADKARREYVWIFQFEKGTFDPASFSPHRRYQFSKMETNSLGSKAGLKTVEDAFRFVASASR